MTEDGRLAGSGGEAGLRGRTLARNTLWSILGQLPPLVFAALAIPLLVGGLGAERFGVLGLVWVFLGLFGALDLGISRATTRAFAERLALGDEEGAEAVAWTSSAVQLALGVVTGAAMAAGAGALVRRVLAVPPGLEAEAVAAFALVGLAIPFVLLGNALRGVLEGGGRFDYVALARGPLGSLSFLLPLVGMWAGLSLAGIVGLLAAGRAVGVGVHFWQCRLAWPGRFATPRMAWGEMGGLARFGAWVAVSSTVIPAFVYLDRFLLGSLASLAAVTHYAAPYEGITRLLLVPASVAGVLFPAFSAAAARGSRDGMARGLGGATRWVALLMTPAVMAVVLLADAILRVWLGPPFPEESALALRFLAGATFLNALGFAPLALVEGTGRPDIVARYHLVELPVYAVVAGYGVAGWGVNGAALAWLLRMSWTIPLFFFICTRVAGLEWRSVFHGATRRTLGTSAVALTLSAALVPMGLGPGSRLLALGALTVVWAATVWVWGLDDADRALLGRYLPGGTTDHA